MSSYFLSICLMAQIINIYKLIKLIYTVNLYLLTKWNIYLHVYQINGQSLIHNTPLECPLIKECVSLKP